MITPQRFPRPRSPLAVAPAPAPAASPALTLPIPSGRDRAEPVGTSIVELSPSPDIPSATTAGLDALGAAAESQFGESTTRYSHADWAREQQAEPACHAVMWYIALSRPPALPDDVLSCFPSRRAPPSRTSRSLLAKATDDGTVLLFRQTTPQPPSDSKRPVGRAACLLNDEPVHIYVPLLMRPWVMKVQH